MLGLFLLKLRPSKYIYKPFRAPSKLFMERLYRFSFGTLLLSIMVLSSGSHLVAGDEETMFRLTQNLVSGRGLTVNNESLVVPQQTILGFLPREARSIFTTSSVQGRYGKSYSKYGIGQSLAAIPLYLFGEGLASISYLEPTEVGGRFAVSMFNPLVLTATGWLLIQFAATLGWSRSTGRWLALAYIFTTFAWPYVKTFYPQPAVAALLLAAVYCAVRWKKQDKVRWLWGCGLACGGLILFRISEIILLIPLLLYLTLISFDRKPNYWPIPVGVPILAAIILTGIYNWLRFGSILSTGYLEVAWDGPLIFGLYGLLLSTGKGILFYAPILFLLPIGLTLFTRQFRAEAWMIIGVGLLILGIYAPYNYWTGGWNWGPRFLLPVVPLGVLVLGPIIEERSDNEIHLNSSNKSYKRRIYWFLFIILMITGFYLQLPAVLVDHSRYLSQQVFEVGQPNAYMQTILQPRNSPLVQQWPTAINLLIFYLNPGSWKTASSTLDELEKFSTGQAVQNGYALLQAEFLRLNTIDLWWLNRGLVNPPLPVWWVVLPFILLVSSISIFGFKKVKVGPVYNIREIYPKLIRRIR